MQNVLAKVRNRAAAVRAYLAPEAFEQRERDRQRAEAAETLETIQRARAWCDGAEKFARDRLDKLNRAELGLDTPAMRGETRTAYFYPRAVPKVEGEYVQVPRTRREVYGHDAAIEETPPRLFAVCAIFLSVLAGAAIAAAAWLRL